MGIKSKKDLVAEYVAMGGNRADFPENLDEVTAAVIQDKLEGFKLQAQLRGEEAGAGAAGADAAGAAGAPAADKAPENTGNAPKADEEKAAPAADEEKAAPAAATKDGAGILFTLKGAASFGSSDLPGKSYKTGVPVPVNDLHEIAVLRASGLFKEGE